MLPETLQNFSNNYNGELLVSSLYWRYMFGIGRYICHVCKFKVSQIEIRVNNRSTVSCFEFHIKIDNTL